MSRTPQLLPSNPSFENQHLQQINLPDGRIYSFDPNNTDEATRAFVEQQRRQQMSIPTPTRGGNNGNGKVAAQRALGVASQVGQIQVQHPPVPRMMVAPNGNGQFYVDAQGRQLLGGWAQGQQRGMPNGQFAPVQPQQLNPQQQQQMVQQHLAQQHYLQQQQQLAQQRGSQTSSARPPALPHKSPALLQVPPPPTKRAVSRTASPSPSPIPAHLRPPSAGKSQPMQPTTSAMPNTGNKPTLLPARAATLPAPSSTQPMCPAPDLNTEAENTAGPSRLPSATAKSQLNMARSDRPHRREAKLSAVARARKREDMTTRLKRHIEQAQAQLDIVIKEEAQAAKDEVDMLDPDDAERRGQFNELLLDYLQRVGYDQALASLRRDMAQASRSSPCISPHSSPVKDLTFPARNAALHSPQAESSTGDATLVENTSAEINLDTKVVSPGQQSAHGASPADDRKSSPSANGSKTINFQDDGKDGVRQNDGEGEAHGSAGSPMKVDAKETASSKGVYSTEGDATRKTASQQSEPVDLGYLYSWWTVFEDTQQLIKHKLLNPASRSPRHTAGMPSGTAMQPTSAMATRIAVSAPATAVRVSSTDPTGQRLGGLPNYLPNFQPAPINTSAPPDEQGGQPPRTALTAQLQAADAMRRSQQAQIDAQNAQQEQDKRRMQSAQNGPGMQNAAMMPGSQRQMAILSNGTQTHMTSEEVQRHMVAQYAYQQQVLQAQQAHQLAQVNGHFPPAGPNGVMRQFHPVPPQYLQPVPDSGDSPSTDSGRSFKRQAESSPVEGSSKKPRLVGKRPTPEEHQRQAIEIANRAALQMPAPTGIPQMPGQLARAQSQGTPRQISDAERQYAQSQVAYARQQVKNSPVAQVGMSPAEPSPINITQSPSIYQSGFEVGINGTPESSKPKKSKQALSLVVDIDNVVEGPDIIPNSGISAASSKKKATKKPPLKAVPAPGKGKGGKGNGKGRGSIAETPPAATPGTGVTISPTYPSNDIFGGPGSVPGSAQSNTFQYPTSAIDQQAHEQYVRNQQHQLQQEDEQMRYQYQSAQNPNQQSVIQQHRQLNMQQSQAATQHSQSSSSQPDPTAQDFLNSLNNFNHDAAAPPQQPASAFPGTFDESAFDFDWATANFGGDENQDWAHLDPTVQENGE